MLVITQPKLRLKQIMWAMNTWSRVTQKRVTRKTVMEYVKKNGWDRLEQELRYWFQQSKRPEFRKPAPHPDQRMIPTKIRFGQIRRGGRFQYNRQEWKRLRGCFAVRVKEIGMGNAGWPFKMGTMVIPLNRSE